MKHLPDHETPPSMDDEIELPAAHFYRQFLRALREAGVPFLVGGAFAHFFHTGIHRSTKDLDLFIVREDYARIADVAQQRGWLAEMSYPHWLAKVYDGREFVDLIFNSGNGVTPVDERWFRNNREVEVLGVPVLIANAEDALLSKAFIMERERYDGGDVAHLLQANAAVLDWPGLLERFGVHWRVFLAHISLFGYIYPGERHHVPEWVTARLVARLASEMNESATPNENICAGTLLSRAQYLHDVATQGYVDGRLTPFSTMTEPDIAAWTEAIAEKKDASA